MFSSLLHASVAGVVLLWIWWAQRDAEPEPLVIFQVPPSTSVSDSTAMPNGAPTTLGVSFTPVPVVVRPAPPPSVPDVAETSVTPSRPEVRTHATPARPQNRPTTLTEHMRQHPRSAVVARPAPVAPSSARINLDEVLATDAASRSAPPAVDAAQVDSYLQRLLGKLRTAHEKPAGLGEGLQVRVEFMLKADGAIGDVRILKTSGNPEFDASVLAAFRRLRDLGVPPAGSAGINQVTFRTQVD
ncbi:energy transducer TonB [Rariglobus hedericola]|uniref:energy transducer TonB n=1 Tax=Rariglobus hedericola TaxID=2597822 RepID=UPI0013967AC5|nr:energy transducer TonB [Rariglobus hedericola]